MVLVKEFFDESTYTLTYLVYDAETSDALVIDPVWDYSAETGKFSEESHKKLLNFINKENLNIINFRNTCTCRSHFRCTVIKEI